MRPRPIKAYGCGVTVFSALEFEVQVFGPPSLTPSQQRDLSTRENENFSPDRPSRRPNHPIAAAKVRLVGETKSRTYSEWDSDVFFERTDAVNKMLMKFATERMAPQKHGIATYSLKIP